MDSATQQVVIGFVMSYVMQWLKKAKWFPFITERSDKIVKVLFSSIVALCTALSIGVNWDATSGVLSFTGLAWVNIWNGLMAFLLSFVTQHVAYEAVIHPAEVNK